MTPERFRQVERVYQDALAHEGPERATFLADVCAADVSLRFEVEALLAHAAPAANFLVRPAMDVAADHLAAAAHTITTGSAIGPYVILSRLGAGGMGEVYRARDSKLGRDVAIKILPRVFGTDPDRRARFDREARLLAALNHPHIGAIYGVEESDGVRALVLELVEGDTLADRLARGPIPVSEALPIARQIADALDAAHEKGIVHRDLKPANIKITPDGIVKVLDFGLAKAARGDAPGPDLTHAPTLTSDGTRDGVILGTAAYMSPEQARGKPVDKRADIWAFGCVLYEMLTSRSAFAGDTISDTIARILEREPDWRALPAATPPTVTRLLRRCLDKDPKRRLHDIADARIEIEDVVSGAFLSSAEAAAVLPRQRPVRLPWTVAVLASLVALVALTWHVWKTPQTQTAFPKEIASSGPFRVLSNYNRSLAITPDSTQVVYTGYNGILYGQPLDRLDRPTRIARTVAPVNFVFVSPNGRWVGFVEGGTLKKVALIGGPATTILNTGEGGSGGATWARDDTIVFATPDPATGLQSVSDEGGAVEELTRPDKSRGELDHIWPEMLPGGRVLFTITAPTGGLDAAQVAVLDPVTKTYKPLIPGGSHAHYVKSGHLVYTARGTLVAAAFDPARPESLGPPETMLPRLMRKRRGAGEFVVSANGTLVYLDAPDFGEPANTPVEVDRRGLETSLQDLPVGHYRQPRVSPEGSRVAFLQDPSVTVWDRDQRKFSATFDSRGQSLVWNGLFLLFAGLVQQAADGTGKPETLGPNGFPSGVTPDGKQVLYSFRQDVMVLTLEGTRLGKPLIEGPANERNGVVSPNGRWLAYETDSSGEFWITVTKVTPFPIVSDGGKWPISIGTRPLWSQKTHELFWVTPDGAIMAVSYDPLGAVWNAGRAREVLKAVYANGDPLGAPNYDVFPDGQRFLMVRQDTAAKIIVVPDWVEKDLKRLVPTR